MEKLNYEMLKIHVIEIFLAQLSEDNYTILDLVQSYLVNEYNMDENSFEYAEAYDEVQKRFISSMRKINKSYQKKGLTAPFNISNNASVITLSSGFKNFAKSFNEINEDPHIFATKIGLKVLESYGIDSSNYFPTSDIKDGGFDFYGYLELKGLIKKKVLFIGEVKLYSGKSITVEQVRSFIGAYTSAKKTKLYVDEMPIIPIYITTSDFTKEAIETAKINGILLYDKALLVSHGLL